MESVNPSGSLVRQLGQARARPPLCPLAACARARPWCSSWPHRAGRDFVSPPAVVRLQARERVPRGAVDERHEGGDALAVLRRGRQRNQKQKGGGGGAGRA